MPRIPLLGGAYEARSLIANCQRCVNLYPEPNQPDAPTQVTHYPTPGLTTLLTNAGVVRGLYTASNGELFAAIGNNLHYVDATWTLHFLAGITAGTTPVSMADNGAALVCVDGTAGWTVNLSTHAAAQILDPDFWPASRVEYLDTYLIFNKVGTSQFFSSDSNAVTFDPLYFASKTGVLGNIQTLGVVHGEIWLIGTTGSEVWFNSGAAPFPFERYPGAFIEMGCAARFSLAKAGRSLFWLGRDRNGQSIVVEGSNYQAKRISTFAIEAAISKYSDVSDAIGYCYQQEGHIFYVLTFPTGDATWCYDVTTGLWHERLATSTGSEHQHRVVCAASAYNKIVGGDVNNGKLYEMSLDVGTDDGGSIKRIRTFPHLVQDGDRVMYRQFIADMQVGEGIRGSGLAASVSLRWSDTRGATWGTPISLSIGSAGDYYLSVQAQRLGMARDRVFELSWTSDVKTALQGAFIEATKAAT